jgi:hypothetical protein
MKFTSVIVFSLAIQLSACGAYDPYLAGKDPLQRYRHYEHYEPTLVQIARMRQSSDHFDHPYESYNITDLDVVNYADHIKCIFQSKFTGARFAGYGFASAQSALAALSGIASLAATGPAAPPALAFVSAFTPDIAKLFNARGRSDAYQNAVANIQKAEISYLKARIEKVGGAANAENVISSTQITVDAVDLYGTVTGNISVVEKVMSGQLPTLGDMKQAAGEKN